MNKKTISVGIPAFNEEQNIENIIMQIMVQNDKYFKLHEIIVYSDGSTDQTVKIVNMMNDKKIKVINSKQRKGVYHAQNEILKKATGEILILINADTSIDNINFFDTLTKRIGKDEVLVCTKIVPLPGKNILEKVINWSHITKTKVYESINNNNIYLCHGRFRAMTRNMYKNIIFPKIIADDAYNYLVCIDQKYKFKYIRSLKVSFRSPNNMSDYLKQSRRFVVGVNELGRLFGDQRIKREYRFNLGKIIPIWLVESFKNPILSVGYLFLIATSLVSLKSNFHEINYKWSVSDSSKKLV